MTEKNEQAQGSELSDQLDQSSDVEIVRNALNGLFSPEGEHDIYQCPFCMSRIKRAYKALARIEKNLA